jgi:hypothetical protein
VVNLATIQCTAGIRKVASRWGVLDWGCGSPRTEFIGSSDGFESVVWGPIWSFAEVIYT